MLTPAEEASILTPPEARLLSTMEQAEQAAREHRIAEAVELRQVCVGLAQLACRDDPYQLALASAELATAYLHAGIAPAAVRHAAHAEGLLAVSDASLPASAVGLLARTLLTLGRALAEGKEYARALEVFPRALAQTGLAHGRRDHVSVCPLLRAYARMVVARSADFTTADALLRRERAVMLQSAGADEAAWTADERRDLVSLDQERGVLLLRHAKALDKVRAPGGADAHASLRCLPSSTATLPASLSRVCTDHPPRLPPWR